MQPLAGPKRAQAAYYHVDPGLDETSCNRIIETRTICIAKSGSLKVGDVHMVVFFILKFSIASSPTNVTGIRRPQLSVFLWSLFSLSEVIKIP
jgi:hypothetical protein